MAIAQELISAFIIFVLGVITSRLYTTFINRRPARKIWHLKNNDEVLFVTSTNPVRDETEYTNTVYPTEYAAATEIATYLTSQLGCVIKGISDADSLPLDSRLEGNLIIIGGPVHNKVADIFLKRLDIPYRFEGYALVHSETAQEYNARIEDDSIQEDYALIVLTSNPLNNRSRVAMLMGCRAYGCLAAARMLIGERARSSARIVARNASEPLVVKTEVVGQHACGFKFVGHLNQAGSDEGER